MTTGFQPFSEEVEATVVITDTGVKKKPSADESGNAYQPGNLVY
jgi:hypothetical protein